MKCHEFLYAAESLTPSQLFLMRTEDPAISTHARECANCGRWLESQTLLGNAMQTLRASTAQWEASPSVEQTVLRAFRTTGFESQETVVPERAAPAAWRLSRFFEYGAYAAVAAALIMGVFLGSRLLHDRQVARQAARTVAQPANTKAPSVAAAHVASIETASSKSTVKEVKTKSVNARGGSSSEAAAKGENAASDSGEYQALMLCDPLICSGDEQVIRMELPATSASADGKAGQTVLADVVVGEDGLVRAMRIVH